METHVAIGSAVYGTPHMRLKEAVGGREEISVWEMWRRREG